MIYFCVEECANVEFFIVEGGGVENVNPRPVTALQRQREREEKRRKKAEKAAERKKKSKGSAIYCNSF